MLKGIKACSNTFWEALWPIIVSALDFGSIGPGSNPGRCQCVAFLSKTLHSHSARCKIGYRHNNAGGGGGGGGRCDVLSSRLGGLKNIPIRFMLRKPVKLDKDRLNTG